MSGAFFLKDDSKNMHRFGFLISLICPKHRQSPGPETQAFFATFLPKQTNRKISKLS